jgi:hypothetical protein
MLARWQGIVRKNSSSRQSRIKNNPKRKCLMFREADIRDTSASSGLNVTKAAEDQNKNLCMHKSWVKTKSKKNVYFSERADIRDISASSVLNVNKMTRDPNKNLTRKVR